MTDSDSSVVPAKYIQVLRLFKARRRAAIDQLVNDDEFNSAVKLADIQLVIAAIEAVIGEDEADTSGQPNSERTILAGEADLILQAAKALAAKKPNKG